MDSAHKGVLAQYTVVVGQQTTKIVYSSQIKWNIIA